MPISQIQIRAGKSDAHRKGIFDSLYRALSEVLQVPDGDHFMTMTEHDHVGFRYGDAFGVSRSDDLVYIQITVFDTRTADQKRALYKRLAELLAERPGLRPEDIFINIYDAPAENWSVGNGVPVADLLPA